MISFSWLTELKWFKIPTQELNAVSKWNYFPLFDRLKFVCVFVRLSVKFRKRTDKNLTI